LKNFGEAKKKTHKKKGGSVKKKKKLRWATKRGTKGGGMKHGGFSKTDP